MSTGPIWGTTRSPWAHVLACWPHLLSLLRNDFGYLELSALRRLQGYCVKIELYLAETHDLTVSEAQAAL
jgi:hypothetical protein